eukprot:25374_3
MKSVMWTIVVTDASSMGHPQLVEAPVRQVWGLFSQLEIVHSFQSSLLTCQSSRGFLDLK